MKFPTGLLVILIVAAYFGAPAIFYATIRADPRRNDSRAMTWLGPAFEHEVDHSEADENCDTRGDAYFGQHVKTTRHVHDM
jgi:hypothetical protein